MLLSAVYLPALVKQLTPIMGKTIGMLTGSSDSSLATMAMS